MDAQIMRFARKRERSYHSIKSALLSRTDASASRIRTLFPFSTDHRHHRLRRFGEVGRPRKVYPGLSSIDVSDKETVMRYVEPLLRFAASHIGPADQPQTLFLFLGTAGMRLLTPQDQRTAYREIVEGVNAMPGLGFRMRLENARTITGTDEAYFAALSVNFMFGHIDRDLRRTRQTLLGALDLGGSSTQIAIPGPVEPGSVRGGHTPRAGTVGDTDFVLASYQLFGVNMMRDMVWKHLVDRHHADADERQITHLTDHIMNPCMLSAHTEVSQAGEIMTGTGDAAGCSHVLRTIMWGMDGRKDCRADSACGAGAVPWTLATGADPWYRGARCPDRQSGRGTTERIESQQPDPVRTGASHWNRG